MSAGTSVVVIQHWWVLPARNNLLQPELPKGPQVVNTALDKNWQWMAGSASCDCSSDLFWRREYVYAAFSFFFFFSFPFPTTTCMSLTVCLVFVDRSHLWPYVPLHKQKGVSGGCGLRTERGCMGEMYLCTHRPTAATGVDSFAHSFSFTSPYILLWPWKFDSAVILTTSTLY